jgi:hypothetical protein
MTGSTFARGGSLLARVAAIQALALVYVDTLRAQRSSFWMGLQFSEIWAVAAGFTFYLLAILVIAGALKSVARLAFGSKASDERQATSIWVICSIAASAAWLGIVLLGSGSISAIELLGVALPMLITLWSFALKRLLGIALSDCATIAFLMMLVGCVGLAASGNQLLYRLSDRTTISILASAASMSLAALGLFSIHLRIRRR